MGIIYGLYCTCHEYRIRYVGQTSRTMKERMRSYRAACKTDKPWPVLHWMRKHGLENVAWVVIEEVDAELLNEREVFWISNFKTFIGSHGLNATAGGGGTRGHKMSEEHRIKQSMRQRGELHHQWGKGLTEETKARISEALKGREVSLETRRKISEKNASRTWSDESRRRASDSHRAYMSNPENRKKLSNYRKGNPRFSGENASAAKLTYDIADAIREEFSTGRLSKAELSRRYGVSPSTIGNVVFNRKWVRNA